MGMTVHYTLRAPNVQTYYDARALVEQLRAYAATLNFDSCSEVHLIENIDDPFVLRFLSCLQEYKKDDGSDSFLSVPPLHLAMFVIEQSGSESAPFGLARFSDTGTDVSDESIQHPSGIAHEYRWRRFCKTHYASLSTNGGWANFFKIHDGICGILDHAKSLGMDVDVRDEGERYEKRDPAALKKEIERWNQLTAAFTGKLKDHYGARANGAVVAPITRTPEFEQLEAKGQEMIGDFDVGDLELPED